MESMCKTLTFKQHKLEILPVPDATLSFTSPLSHLGIQPYADVICCFYQENTNSNLPLHGLEGGLNSPSSSTYDIKLYGALVDVHATTP